MLENDGEQLSAAQTRQRALTAADHLAFLHAIWAAETTPARERRYWGWLWRTLRVAELAGLDAGQVLAAAVGERDLTGARDVPPAIDARLRHRTGSLVPLPAGPWLARLPEIGDPGRPDSPCSALPASRPTESIPSSSPP